jgi:hypothetical protein
VGVDPRGGLDRLDQRVTRWPWIRAVVSTGSRRVAGWPWICAGISTGSTGGWPGGRVSAFS